MKEYLRLSVAHISNESLARHGAIRPLPPTNSDHTIKRMGLDSFVVKHDTELREVYQKKLQNPAASIASLAPTRKLAAVFRRWLELQNINPDTVLRPISKNNYAKSLHATKT